MGSASRGVERQAWQGVSRRGAAWHGSAGMASPCVPWVGKPRLVVGTAGMAGRGDPGFGSPRHVRERGPLGEFPGGPFSCDKRRMAGRKPLPTNIRVLEGNRGKRPIKAGMAVPVPPDMPDPPDFLSAYAVEEWQRVAPELYSLGVLTSLDRATLAAYCQAYGRWRMAEEKYLVTANADPISGGILAVTKAGNVIQSPLLSAANAAYRDMVRIAAEFGMTPSARARIEGKRGQEDDAIGRKYGIR